MIDMEGIMSRIYTLGFLVFSSGQQTNYNSMYIHIIIKATLASRMD